MEELKHVAVARSYIGIHEIKGPKHEAKILEWWKLAHTTFTDDETPWCAGFVSGILEEAGYVSARTGWARGYLKWGTKLSGPAYGSIAVLERGPTSGHVAFVVGRDKFGNLMLLGGNQSDAVNIKAFDPKRVLSYRWPSELALPKFIGKGLLPVLKTDGTLSSNEA